MTYYNVVDAIFKKCYIAPSLGKSGVKVLIATVQENSMGVNRGLDGFIKQQ